MIIKETSPSMHDIWVLDNSIQDEDHKQTNNLRNPSVTCFPTSMINCGKTIGLKTKDFPKPVDPKYTQEEDAFDEFIASDFVTTWWRKRPDFVNAVDVQKLHPRELWEIEVFAWNEWMNKTRPDLYPMARIDWNMTVKEMVDHLTTGGAIVTSGKFAGFAHVICVVGAVFTGGIPGNEGAFNENTITHVVVDDSYGNPLNSYKPVGVGGNSVRLPLKYFMDCTVRSGGVRFGIFMDKARKDPSESITPRPQAVVETKSQTI
jgi:hypothetical protein